MDTIGKRIRAVLDWREMSVTEAAAKIHLSRPQFTKWASDKVAKPDVKILGEFAKVTDVSLDWLRTGHGPAPDLAPPEPVVPTDTIIKVLLQRLPKSGPFSVDARVDWLKMMVVGFQIAYGHETDIEITKKQA